MIKIRVVVMREGWMNMHICTDAIIAHKIYDDGSDRIDDEGIGVSHFVRRPVTFN